MRGSAAITACSDSSFESSTRSGLVSMRRWLSRPGGPYLQELGAQEFLPHVGRTQSAASDGVECPADALEFQGREIGHDHFDDFGVDRLSLPPRTSAPIWLKLPVAAFFAPFAPEHGPR